VLILDTCCQEALSSTANQISVNHLLIVTDNEKNIFMNIHNIQLPVSCCRQPRHQTLQKTEREQRETSFYASKRTPFRNLTKYSINTSHINQSINHLFAQTTITRMWANAQRDVRPAEYRWRPLYNAAKFWLTPTTGVPCSNAAKTRNPLKFAGVPQINETISAASGPKFTILRGHVEEILLLNNFFPIVDTCRSFEGIA